MKSDNAVLGKLGVLQGKLPSRRCSVDSDAGDRLGQLNRPERGRQADATGGEMLLPGKLGSLRHNKMERTTIQGPNP